MMSRALADIGQLIREANIRARKSSISRRRTRDPTRPAAKWVASAPIGQATGTALSLVLSTHGCSYALSEAGGCTMCSYLLDGTNSAVSSEHLLSQFEKGMDALAGETGPLSVKIYTSGSFLDESEVPLDARRAIVEHLGSDDRVKEVVLESRPEFVTENALQFIAQTLENKHIEIGMGLESSNDLVRQICINKGFSTEDFTSAVKRALEFGVGTRAYVLVKPPFMTERAALEDAVQTISDAAALGVTTVSINPVNIQRFTLVEQLWRRGDYRPPWLWTLIEVLRRSRESHPISMRILCDPVAGGKSRGTHNCGRCDSTIVKAIREYSLTQDAQRLPNGECDCKRLWEHTLLHEGPSMFVHEDIGRGPLGNA